jgi:hypothetical protein
MATQERICETCGIRCRRGWLRVNVAGQIQAPNVNLDTEGGESVYCSETCLRTRLLGPGEEAALIRDLERQLRRLRRIRRDPDYDYLGSTQQQLDELRNLLRVVGDQVRVLQDADTTKATPGSEEAERFQHAAANLIRLLDPVINPRQRNLS